MLSLLLINAISVQPTALNVKTPLIVLPARIPTSSIVLTNVNSVQPNVPSVKIKLTVKLA